LTQPGGKPRPAAWSQSLPAANTSDVGRIVVSLSEGVPELPDPPADAPTPLAPSIATTVRDWLKPGFESEELTRAAASGARALAVQISLSPELRSARLTRRQLSPPPVTVARC